MVFHEPRIEFIRLSMEDVIATSGAAYTVCQNNGGGAMCANEFCAEMKDPPMVY